MTWSRRHTLIAGIALIALTNAVALIGVWYNRSGEPESALRLTQRELAPPYWRGVDRESGGLELRPRAQGFIASSAGPDVYLQVNIPVLEDIRGNGGHGPYGDGIDPVDDLNGGLLLLPG